MTFIHEGNANYVDKLVNFEKMVWKSYFQMLLCNYFLTNHILSIDWLEEFPFSPCRSECLPKQWKSFEDAEANLMVSDSLAAKWSGPLTSYLWDCMHSGKVGSNSHACWSKHIQCSFVHKSGKIMFYFPSAVPSSPQRGLADRMFLEGAATRLSTCKPHL